jgi:hypothetical protein
MLRLQQSGAAADAIAAAAVVVQCTRYSLHGGFELLE